MPDISNLSRNDIEELSAYLDWTGRCQDPSEDAGMEAEHRRAYLAKICAEVDAEHRYSGRWYSSSETEQAVVRDFINLVKERLRKEIFPNVAKDNELQLAVQIVAESKRYYPAKPSRNVADILAYATELAIEGKIRFGHQGPAWTPSVSPPLEYMKIVIKNAVSASCVSMALKKLSTQEQGRLGNYAAFRGRFLERFTHESCEDLLSEAMTAALAGRFVWNPDSGLILTDWLTRVISSLASQKTIAAFGAQPRNRRYRDLMSLPAAERHKVLAELTESDRDKLLYSMNADMIENLYGDGTLRAQEARIVHIDPSLLPSRQTSTALCSESDRTELIRRMKGFRKFKGDANVQNLLDLMLTDPGITADELQSAMKVDKKTYINAVARLFRTFASPRVADELEKDLQPGELAPRYRNEVFGELLQEGTQLVKSAADSMSKDEAMNYLEDLYGEVGDEAPWPDEETSVNGDKDLGE